LIQISAREAQLDASTLAYKGIQLEEEVGARSILDVLDVNQDVLDARLSLIDAKTNKVKSYYRLLNAIGLIEKPFLG
jgi:outer membrane protein